MADTQIEITPQELKTLPQDSYQLIDTRRRRKHCLRNGKRRDPHPAGSRSRPAHL